MAPRFSLKWIVLAGLACCLTISCAAPRILWHEKDHPASAISSTIAKHTVVVASRDSEFKRDVVQKVSKALAGEDTVVTIVGIGDLNRIDAGKYDVVVVLNSCIAWRMDPEVQTFIDHQDRQADIIVVTTSGAGDWVPKQKGHRYDAVSSASKLTSADALARDVTARVRRRFHTRQP